MRTTEHYSPVGDSEETIHALLDQHMLAVPRSPRLDPISDTWFYSQVLISTMTFRLLRLSVSNGTHVQHLF
jgi:hypothetical protein